MGQSSGFRAVGNGLGFGQEGLVSMLHLLAPDAVLSTIAATK